MLRNGTCSVAKEDRFATGNMTTMLPPAEGPGEHFVFPNTVSRPAIQAAGEQAYLSRNVIALDSIRLVIYKDTAVNQYTER